MEDSSLIDRLERLGLREGDRYVPLHPRTRRGESEHHRRRRRRLQALRLQRQRETRRPRVRRSERPRRPNASSAPTPEEVVERLSSELPIAGPLTSHRAGTASATTAASSRSSKPSPRSSNASASSPERRGGSDAVHPRETPPQIADELRETVDRNVLVFVLLTGDESTELDVFGDHPPASVVRV